MPSKRNMTVNVTTALRLVVALVMCFVNLFFTRAQVSDAYAKDVKVLFRFDNAAVSADYLSNASALKDLDSMISLAAENGETLSIVTFSSPEGNYNYNQKLSEKRAAAIKDYIASRNSSAAVNVKIVSGAESWEDLRSKVVTDSRLTQNQREEILQIIGSNDDPDSKETLLKANSAYKQLYNNYFRGLRFANISLRIENLASTTPKHTTVSFSESKPSKGAPVVYYALSEDFIRPDYMGNAENLKEIRRILSNPANREKEIVLEGSASPEGPVSANNRLGIKRAQNLADWLVGQFPDLEGRIVIRSKGEDWEGLRAQVENCSALDANAKDELLAIINSNDTPAKKEELLKNHASYSVVEKECLPYIRYAKFGGFEDMTPKEEKPAEPVLPVLEEPEITADQDTTEFTTVAHDSLAVNTPVAEQQSFLPEPEKEVYDPDSERPFMAVGTNMLYDVLLTPNVNLDIPVSKHVSITGDYTFPWWLSPTNNRAWQILKWDLGARYWFNGGNRNIKTAFTGLFTGIDLGAGYYDIEPYHKGYQGEFQLAGLELGYAWKLNGNWRIDASAGFGWMGSHYRYYEGTDDDVHLIYQYHGKINWFGPVKAEIGLRYVFTRDARRNVR